MKNNGSFKVIIVLLIFLFGLKTLSEILQNKALEDGAKYDKGLLLLSGKVFPFSSDVNYQTANLLLDEFIQTENQNVLEGCIRKFKRSITLNKLNFYSYFGLAKSLMQYGPETPLHFEEALMSLKTASNIRGTNLKLNMEILKVYLSLWPFLPEEDKVWSGGLMNRLILRLRKDDFKEILVIWGLYSKDTEFLKYTFNHKARYYKEIIDEMEKHELDLPMRQKFMAYLENKFLVDYENKYKEALTRGGIPFSSYIRVSRYLRFYFKIVKDIKFRENKYSNLKKEINFYIIKKLIDFQEKKDRLKLYEYIGYYLQDFDLIKDIEDLEVFLNTKQFFQSNDLRVFYIKQLINFKTGQVSKMISETESFRQSVSFIKEGQEKDLVELLTLLADSYIDSRLLTKAMDTLKDIEKVSPGLMSTYWRLIRVESIIGEDPVFNSFRQEKFAQVRNSNVFSISKANLKFTVYPYEVDNLVINLDDEFILNFREYHLLQVFVNGRIFHESYIVGLEFPVDLPIPDELKKVRFEVEIKLVK